MRTLRRRHPIAQCRSSRQLRPGRCCRELQTRGRPTGAARCAATVSFVGGQRMIKPIQTTYRGYRFRSRLEARWAVFFDALGLRWEYEPEGFVLPSGKHYLPDFRVKLRKLGKSNYRSDMNYAPRDVTIWFEIKPGDQGENELFSEFMREGPSDWR